MTTRAAGDAVELVVSDKGPGIPTDVLSQVFEPFFTTKDGGTGLGLATVYGIITQSGGNVAAESTLVVTHTPTSGKMIPKMTPTIMIPLLSKPSRGARLTSDSRIRFW